ncbi:MAG: SEC-C metal-binding domain-containing protein [Desulfuromonadales bacterium]|nr:SEC-C metal-binding domain-containing protein [Desulfuromonadales bacterium]
MSNIGRNEPCPCGSGKKYKKCCLDKDQTEQRAQREAQKLLPPASADAWREEPDAWDEAQEWEEDPYMDELYSRFDTADFAERLDMFREMISQNQGTEGDLFDIFAVLQESATDDTARRELNNILVELRRQRPDCWEENLGFYVHSFLANALAAGNTSNIDAYFLEASRQPARHIDYYSQTIDLLAYHGRHRELTEGLCLALPEVRKADGLMSWVADDIASRLIDCEILSWMEADPTGTDVTALQRIGEEIMPNIDSESLRTYAEHLVGRQRFSPVNLRDEKNRLDLKQISFLTAAFVGYLIRECGVAGITALLAGRELCHYFARREAGDLKPVKRSRFAAKQSSAKKHKGASAHVLFPDPDTLDRFIASQLHLLSCADHAVTVLALSLPALSDFLAGQNLLDPDADEEHLALLTPAIRTLIQIFEKNSDDPTLAPALREAWADIS